MIKDPKSIDGQAFDTTLAITVENIIKEIKDRGTICQNDIISIESLLGEKIITEEHNINKFCTVRDSFNSNIVLESLDNYMRRSFNVHYRISLSRKLEAISETIKDLFYSIPTYNFLRDYTRGKAYNSNGILVNVNELTINELLNAIFSISLEFGGVNGTVSLIRIVSDENPKRVYDVPYSTLLTIINNIIPNNIEDTGLYDIENKRIRTNRFTLESTMVTIICSMVGNNELMDGLLNINNLTGNYDVGGNAAGNDVDIAIFNKIKSYDYISNYLKSDGGRTRSIISKLEKLSEELSTGTIGDFRNYGYNSYILIEDIVRTLSNGEDTEYFNLNTGNIPGSILPSSVYYTLSKIFNILYKSFMEVGSGIREEILTFNNCKM